MNRGETICQQETEQDLRVWAQAREEAWADARAQRRAGGNLPLVRAASAAPDAEACKATDLAGGCIARIQLIRKKKRLNSSAARCSRGLIKSMPN